VSLPELEKLADPILAAYRELSAYLGCPPGMTRFEASVGLDSPYAMSITVTAPDGNSITREIDPPPGFGP
jgi:hypothetical protein